MNGKRENSTIISELTPSRIREWTEAMQGFKPLSFEYMKTFVINKKHLYKPFKDIQDFFNTHKNLSKEKLIELVRRRQEELGFRPNCNLWKLNGIRQFIRIYESMARKFQVSEKMSLRKGKHSLHKFVEDMLYKIGEIEGKVSEKEYPINHWYIDIVWKRIKSGVPTHAFEVQIGGNFYQALTKLKHAFDKWNCFPILVTTEKYEEKAKQLLNGSFHEMKNKARIINWKTVQRLYRLEKQVKNLKAEVCL
ncbi:MAG: hypothetical protein ACTSV7_10450 [Candidatus Baldrarchaeia archaeon]